MKKKTIGSFISTLRKANGMTQKELAEYLNVSDKTVSRWERDDGAPDLALIPVIAEIFNVTCDELLRGERKSSTERAEMPEDKEISPKGEKQRKRLLKSTLSQYQNYTCIAVGVSVVGMIVALIGNLAFLKAVLGFLLGAIFFAASIVCQIVFMNKVFLSIEDAGIDVESLSIYKRKVIRLAEKSIGLTVFFIGFTFPLIMVDAYMGLGADSLLIWGTIGAAVFMIFYVVVLYFLNGLLLKKGIYKLSDKEKVIYEHERKLKKKCFISLAIIMIATLLFHVFGGEMIWSAYNLSSLYGITFDDYDSFVEYMEQDIPVDIYETNYKGTISIPVREEQLGNPTYYDEFDNEISEEEALTRTMKDSNGNIVCTYIQRNQNVSNIRYTAKNGTVLPIQVIMTGDYRTAVKVSNLITTVYCVLYPIELFIVFLAYFKKRREFFN